jgi:hypothetical protein
MEPRLPIGYYLEFDSDVLVLRRRREKGEFVAAFGPRGATKEAIEQAAWDDLLEQASLELFDPHTEEGD